MQVAGNKYNKQAADDSKTQTQDGVGVAGELRGSCVMRRKNTKPKKSRIKTLSYAILNSYDKIHGTLSAI